MKLQQFFIIAMVFSFVNACTHLESQVLKQKKEQAAKNTMMSERIARLERQVTMLNRQIELLSDGRISSSDLSQNEYSTGHAQSERMSSLRDLQQDSGKKKNNKADEKREKLRKIGISQQSVDLSDLYDRDSHQVDVIEKSFKSVELTGVEDTSGGNSSEKTSKQEALVENRSEDRMPADIEINNQMLAAFHKKKQKSRQKQVHRRYKSAKALYAAAMEALKHNSYGKARLLFGVLEKKYSKHHLADNAYYWSAISFKKEGKIQIALKMLAQLPKKYPKSNKLGDALFNLGEIAEEQEKHQLARQIYQQYKEVHPSGEYIHQVNLKLSAQR